MRDIKGIGLKPRKAPYQKPEAVRELERLADAEARRLHPTLDPRFVAPRKYRDDGANSMTKCVVEYIRLNGGFASRISNQGTYNSKLRKYIPGTSRKGLADVMATFKGLSLHIEVKHGRDVQSEAQKRIESEVIRAGGRYYLARNFTDFKIWFDAI